jgi:hypothetical protein
MPQAACEPGLCDSSCGLRLAGSSPTCVLRPMVLPGCSLLHSRSIASLSTSTSYMDTFRAAPLAAAAAAALLPDAPAAAAAAAMSLSSPLLLPLLLLVLAAALRWFLRSLNLKKMRYRCACLFSALGSTCCCSRRSTTTANECSSSTHKLQARDGGTAVQLTQCSNSELLTPATATRLPLHAPWCSQ